MGGGDRFMQSFEAVVHEFGASRPLGMRSSVRLGAISMPFTVEGGYSVPEHGELRSDLAVECIDARDESFQCRKINGYLIGWRHADVPFSRLK